MIREDKKTECLRRHKGKKSSSVSQIDFTQSYDCKNETEKSSDCKKSVVNRNNNANIKTTRKSEKVIVFLCFMTVFCIVACIVFSALYRYDVIDDILLDFNKESKISDTGCYDFGSFEGFVTVGDSLENALKILGLPDQAVDNLYYYGNSYIIVEESTVVGYYKDSADDIHITVGFKKVDGRISKGDNPARVVSLLGSPAYYLKDEWIYENISHQFEHINYDGIATRLTVHFDENYKVSGYVFSE